ncbi:hypothetical protein [Pseudescherichia sp. AS216]|uniref:hypothetical protein n=1 Tax=Pseudescherichia sp. AS216 TaxID=3081295 RepID=UPI00301CCA4C
MESKTKELVKAGHELVVLLGTQHGMHDAASLVQRLTAQLDITAIVLREKSKQCDALAAENAYLLPRAASELSNAWVLHKYLIGIQAAIMYLDNGNKKAAQEWLYGTIAGPGFEFPDEVDDIDAWATHQMRASINHPRAQEIIKEETPATDSFLREQMAKGVEMFAKAASDKASSCSLKVHAGYWTHAKEAAEYFAAKLRAGEANHG